MQYFLISQFDYYLPGMFFYVPRVNESNVFESKINNKHLEEQNGYESLFQQIFV